MTKNSGFGRRQAPTTRNRKPTSDRAAAKQNPQKWEKRAGGGLGLSEDDMDRNRAETRAGSGAAWTVAGLYAIDMLFLPNAFFGPSINPPAASESAEMMTNLNTGVAFGLAVLGVAAYIGGRISPILIFPLLIYFLVVAFMAEFPNTFWICGVGACLFSAAYGVYGSIRHYLSDGFGS